MQFKKLIFVLVIIIIITFGLLLGISYAYYVSIDGIELNERTGNFDAGVAIVFKQSEFINTVTGVPISESDIEEKADKTVFTLVPNATKLEGYDVLINISLINIKIDDALKNEKFKYKLTCSSDGSSTVLSSGDLSNIGDATSLKLGSLSTNSSADTKFATDKETTCTLYIWLEESNNNQNELMNKGFSGVVKVDSVFKK